MAHTPIEYATAFVDWNSQVHAQPKKRTASEAELAIDTLQHVARVVSASLNAISNELRFDVALRLYHGWRKGFEPTVRRKALITAVAAADFPTLSRRSNVSLRPEVEFGDFLSSARLSRLHDRIHCHIPNTLRRRNGSVDEWEEKMVDTAIASDVVDLAHREHEQWLVVVGDDDDLIPPTFVAEGARRNNKVLLIRDRGDSPFFKLGGIGVRP